MDARQQDAELETLLRALSALRAGVLDKLAGLSEEDARRSAVPTGTDLAGSFST